MTPTPESFTSGKPGDGELSLDLNRELKDRREDLIRLRRDFHAHPELSFKEGRTAQITADRLERMGLQVRRNVGQTGVVAVLEGGKPGRTVMWRADMDGLPIQEDQDMTEFPSENAGVMHACGHDAHTAIGITVADILNSHKKELPGKVVFVFQPAEEIGGGAKAMLADGLFQPGGPGAGRPDVTLGLHVASYYDAGKVQITGGPLMAALDTIIIDIVGVGGHAAAPHLTVDPIVVACELVVALQTLISRETSPNEAAVLTFGSLHAGTKENIIPVEARLMGTMRTLNPELRDYLIKRVEEMTVTLCQAFRAKARFQVRESLPAVINDERIAALAKISAIKAVGEKDVEKAEPRMGSEDMSFFLNEVPGCFINIGAGIPGHAIAPHHSPLFIIDELCLDAGVKAATQTILDLLPVNTSY